MTDKSLNTTKNPIPVFRLLISCVNSIEPALLSLHSFYLPIAAGAVCKLKMRFNNTIAAAILATTIIIATSTSFAAEVNIHADGTMSNPETTTSTTWPDKTLKGMDGEEAQREIKSVDPSLETHVLPEDAIVTEDYRLDRVRIFVDTNGKVVTQPQKG